ncbi:hypothetical protein B0T17DRAFT_658199 [Bombardia bombarda]|uniref:NAD(P)-binding protein n=1 Tax=Bombardia bombarda TaxID=252184 RepID=A0AA39U1D6_9PEZI|nr:hypothetical protein B0T17DRAFT_658199 [Bombardia bombarda]
MAEIIFSETTARQLQGKVVVITGGAQGIGAATVGLLYQYGAHVFFGDWDATRGKQVETDLRSKTGGTGSVTYRQVDVSDYQSQLALFDGAHKQHGHVDVAIACAAVGEPAGWFEPGDLDLEKVKTEPAPINRLITINLTSILSFTRIALAYMKASSTPTDPPSQQQQQQQQQQPQSNFSKSIILVSSIAGISPAPGLFGYSASKHGLIGLMRALAPWAPIRYGVRANAICPWATDTQLLAGVRGAWLDAKLPINTPEDVARQIVLSAADGSQNGKAVLVTGGRGFDTEEGIERTQPLWMGETNAREFREGQVVLGLGDNWN